MMKLFIFDVYQGNQHLRTEKVPASNEEAAYSEIERRVAIMDEPCLEYEFGESGEACPLCPEDDTDMIKDGYSVDGIACCEWCCYTDQLFGAEPTEAEMIQIVGDEIA